MRRLAVLILISSFLQQVGFSAGCGVPSTALSARRYSQSKLVVIAETERANNISNPKIHKTTLNIPLRRTETLRGEVGAKFRVWEEKQLWGEASFSWSVGKTYLLFSKCNRRGQVGWLYGCGNSAPIERSRSSRLKVHRVLEKTAMGGTIQGLVTDGGRYHPMSTDLSGITIQIHGKGFATTRLLPMARGRVQGSCFRRGHYAVVPVQAGRRFKNDFLGF